MKNKSIFLKIYIVFIIILAISIIILYVLGKKERIGYLSDFEINVDKTLEINGLDSEKTKKLFIIEDKLDETFINNFLFTNISITNYSYNFRIKYYNKVFRNSDIYGVYPNINQILENNNYIKKIEMNENGGPFGNLISSKVIDAEKIDSNNLRNWIHNDGFFVEQFPIVSQELSNDDYGQITFDTPSIKIDSEEFVMEYEDIADISDTFKMEFRNTGIMTNGKIYTEKTEPLHTEGFTLLRDVLESDVDEKYYLDGDNEKLEKWKYLKGAKKIPRVSKTGHEYVFSEGPLAFPDPIDRPARTMLTSESSVNRSTHVVEDPQTKRLRLLTPVEAERLNGFEDNWTNSGMPEKFRYFCMGNALVVNLIEKMGISIKNIVDCEETIVDLNNKTKNNDITFDNNIDLSINIREIYNILSKLLEKTEYIEKIIYNEGNSKTKMRMKELYSKEELLKVRKSLESLKIIDKLIDDILIDK